MDDVWAIVLAAGSSTRMKKQKLLLPFNGKSMIEAVIQNIQPVLNNNIVVVLGSHRNEIKKEIGNLPVGFCINDNYKEGMLSSVICGFRSVPRNAGAALVFLGDQPHIPPGVTQQVIKAWKDARGEIIIPKFNGKRGHPVLIEMKFKTEIEKLDPGKGLRELMVKFSHNICEVE
ncbi:MAG: nucleotidyltransferase family protein, partial [Prolixibacteraceae bacterium]